MSYESIEITPVTPRIGAMVAGVTLAKPLSNRESGTGPGCVLFTQPGPGAVMCGAAK